MSPPRYLRVTINPSTTNIIEGAVYGLDVDLENVSNIPISIDTKDVQLVVQPELAPSNVACGWVYDAGTSSGVSSVVMLLPGDHFTVFFLLERLVPKG